MDLGLDREPVYRSMFGLVLALAKFNYLKWVLAKADLFFTSLRRYTCSNDYLAGKYIVIYFVGVN